MEAVNVESVAPGTGPTFQKSRSCWRRPITLACLGFVVVLVIVIVAEYFIVHAVDENSSSSDTDSSSVVDLLALPDGFMMASATSAYQIEGAWNASDKGVNIWDTLSHSGTLTDTGDDACKSYEFYKTDVQMLVQTGFNAYRFSISWSRVLPNGTADYISTDGIAYYNNLINELLAYNITPLVTIYHWDLPQVFEDQGGWLNSSIADWFTAYSGVVFDKFGDRVKWWITFNEPDKIVDGYTGTGYAPALGAESGTVGYNVIHNIIRAHGKAYRLYEKSYKSTQNGSVGMTYQINGVWPLNSSSSDDLEAADRQWQWNAGLYAHAIYSPEGNYPSIVRERIDNFSLAEGRNVSRLPHFTDEELAEITGSYDFIGVNNYGSVYVSASTTSGTASSPSMTTDAGVTVSGASPTGDGLKTVLNWLRLSYNRPPTIITETGLNSASEGLNDTSRITLYHSMIKGVLEALYEDDCDMFGFTAWSLMDNFEWNSGYTPKYGIWQVDFTAANRTRTMKQSGYWFQELVSTWRLPNTTNYIVKSISLAKRIFFFVSFVAVVVVVGLVVFFVTRNAYEEQSSSSGSHTTSSSTMGPDLLALPDNFIMACATSSYQIEGAWNTDGKGENIWDRMCHDEPELISNMDTGDVACDSYNLYKTDVQMVRQTGFDVYRFSISWSRVFPYGTVNNVSSAGVQYYHDLLDELLAYNITPLVTLYHWDLPQPLQDLGGWANTSMVNYFIDYCDYLFNEYGDKVHWWVSLNEPRSIRIGYGGTYYAPALNDSGVSDYLASHNLLIAHAKVYHLYNDTYKTSQQGKLGITVESRWYVPLNKSSIGDQEAVTRAMAFQTGIFTHPIFSSEGNYPAVVRERVDQNSFAEGRNHSRLPYFTDEEVDMIRGSSDFFGINYYYVTAVSNGTSSVDADPSFNRDSGATYYNNTHDADGLRHLLNWIKDEYDSPPIFVTENGCHSDMGLNDTDRIEKHYEFLAAVLEAVYEDKCDVIGYTVWSIMDNFEWSVGYTKNFGLWYVDFTSQNRTRTMKQSAYWFQELLLNRRLPSASSYS